MSTHICPHCGHAFACADAPLLLPPPSHFAPKRAVPQERRARAAKQKVKDGKHVTIVHIASSLGRSPRDCRQALRTLAIPKPIHGWAWPPSEARVVETRLRKKFGIAPSSREPSAAHDPLAAAAAETNIITLRK